MQPDSPGTELLSTRVVIKRGKIKLVDACKSHRSFGGDGEVVGDEQMCVCPG